MTWDSVFRAKARTSVIKRLAKRAKDPELRKQARHTLAMWAKGMDGPEFKEAALAALAELEKGGGK